MFYEWDFDSQILNGSACKGKIFFTNVWETIEMISTK